MTPEEASRLTAVEERSKSNTHRINELSGQIVAVNKLAVSVELLVQENKHQTETASRGSAALLHLRAASAILHF